MWRFTFIYNTIRELTSPFYVPLYAVPGIRIIWILETLTSILRVFRSWWWCYWFVYYFGQSLSFRVYVQGLWPASSDLFSLMKTDPSSLYLTWSRVCFLNKIINNPRGNECTNECELSNAIVLPRNRPSNKQGTDENDSVLLTHQLNDSSGGTMGSIRGSLSPGREPVVWPLSCGNGSIVKSSRTDPRVRFKDGGLGTSGGSHLEIGVVRWQLGFQRVSFGLFWREYNPKIPWVIYPGEKGRVEDSVNSPYP